MRDPYDIRVAFDDVTGDEAAETDYVAAARAVLERARRRRLRPPPAQVVGAVDMTEWTFAYPDVVVGAGGADGDVGLPLFDRIRRRFSEALPEPKAVRVDDEASYREFREARREPYIRKLEARLDALERALAEHVSDRHGGGRLTALEDRLARHVGDPDAHRRALPALPATAGSDVLGAALAEVAHGGSRIALPIRESREGKIECWRDGGEILCSARVLGDDGRPRVLTSGTQARRHACEVARCAALAGLDAEDTLIVGPPLVEVLGAASLLPEICRAAPQLVSRAGSGTFVGAMVPDSDPRVAAAMALLQRAQLGDRRAAAESAVLGRLDGALFEDARERLVRAQREKWRTA